VASPPTQKTAQNIGGEVETEVTDNQGVSTSVTGDGGELNVADDVTNQGPQAVAPVTLGGNDHLQQPVTEHNSSTSTGSPSPQHDVTTTTSGHGETVINHRLKGANL
jgi:lysophospholipase L1-like esterase